MFCRLTLFALTSFIVVGIARGQTASRRVDQASIVGEATTLSVDWEGVSLGEAVAKLQESSKAAIFLDRRVDPTQRVELSVDNATPREILEKLAVDRSLGVGQLDSLLYLGPARAAAELNSLESLRQADISRLSPQDRQSLSKRVVVIWPRLTEPDDLIARFALDHGWQVIGRERIPYDLWPAGQLPKMTMADALATLLIGFDLTYRPLPGNQTIEISPIGDGVASGKAVPAPAARAVRSSQATKQKTVQRYTLRVQEQPVGKVLEQLGRQLHLEVKVDEASIKAAGRSMDERVSFEVNDADLEGLLDAVLRPAGLTFERDGEQLKILSR
jgi:hypothetical protein